MNALDRAKRVQATLTKLVERRERIVQRAAADFRLDLLAAIDQVDDATLELVQRGLAMDHGERELQVALQLAIAERSARNERLDGLVEVAREGPLVMLDSPSTRRSGLPAAPGCDDGDEDDLTGLDTPSAPATPFGEAFERLAQAGKVGAVTVDGETVSLGELRYPEPGEPALTLADGTVVAAP